MSEASHKHFVADLHAPGVMVRSTLVDGELRELWNLDHVEHLDDLVMISV